MSERLSLSQIRAALKSLTLEQAKRLQGELEKTIQKLEHQQEISQPKSSGKREIVQVQHVGDRIYQLEQIRCGKPGCKCAGENGELHGPYWYAYWRESGKLKSRYIGKKLDLEK